MLMNIKMIQANEHKIQANEQKNDQLIFPLLTYSIFKLR